jgi:hypothetical protein
MLLSLQILFGSFPMCRSCFSLILKLIDPSGSTDSGKKCEKFCGRRLGQWFSIIAAAASVSYDSA